MTKIDSSPDRALIYEEIVDQLYRNSLFSIIAVILACSVIAYLQWIPGNPEVTALLLSMVIASFSRLGFYLQYIKKNPASGQRQAWGRYYFYTVSILGILFAMGLFYAFPKSSPEQQSLLFLTLIVLNTGAFTTFGIWFKCFAIFITSVLLLPLPVYWQVGYRQEVFLIIGAYLFFLRNSYTVSSITRSNIRSRINAEKRKYDESDAQKKNLEIFTHMASANSGFIVYIDVDGVYQQVNNAFLKYMNISREEVVGKHASEIHPVNYKQKIEPALEKCFQGYPVMSEFWVERAGSKVCLSCRFDPHKDIEGNVQGAIITSYDVTESKKLEAELKESREILFLALNATPIAVSIHSYKDRKFIYVNPAHEKLHGYSKKELIGKNSKEMNLWVYNEEREESRELLKPEEEVINFKVHTRHKDGRIIPLKMSSAPFKLNNEHCYVMWQEDLSESIKKESERARLEKQLQQATKMEAIGQLTGGIAHDFNNILQSILGFSELAKLNMQESQDEETVSYLDHIHHSAGRAQDMIKQLVTFSRTESKESNLQSLQPLVENVLKLLRPSFPSTIEIKTNLKSDLPQVLIDEVMLEQILMNLCINARDAIDGEGEIKIKCKEVFFNPRVCDSCHEAFSGKMVELSIKDSGRGIQEDVLRSIFHPFFTTKEVGEGSGLGLAMVHGTMHNFNGHIVVHSTFGEGTEFRLYFPLDYSEHLVSKNDVEEIKEPVEEEKQVNSGTIMIVDDEPDITNYLSRLLSMHGYGTITYNNSREALAAYSETPTKFDLVITDQTMPSLTGMELSLEIKKINDAVKIIICSGNIADLEELVIEDLGATCLSKPLDSRQLLQQIKDNIL